MKELKVKGSTIQSFSNICINLDYFAEPELLGYIKDVKDPNKWYPFRILKDLFNLIEEKYSNPSVFFEQIAEETMRIWFENGEGKDIIESGVDFLRYQSGSEGYWSMVKGPEDKIGRFHLKELDEKNGTAILIDTSPFHYAYTKGIISGGMKGGGDIKSVKIGYEEESKTFHVSFK